MGKKVMLINATDSEEIRVAVLKDGVLSDFDIELVHNEKIKGNVYKAKVTRVDQSLQAAFVHYGGQKNGFLPMGELPRDLVGPEGRRGRIHDLLQKDQEIMVQVIREELGSKGAMVTAQISLPGRYLVLTPGNSVNGISRKIEDRGEREHFRELVDALEVPAGMGIIVRTASMGVTKEDFEKDLKNLLDTYKEVQANYKKCAGAGLVWQEDDVVTRTLRDTWTPDIGEVHIDDHDTFLAAQAFFRRTMPQHLGALHHYNAKKPIFSKFQTEEQIERIYARRVPLPSGGAIVIDQTEALVAIDVNSGKTSGDNQEDTALRTNLEAADAIASQLRLRDLAGLIAIDFIDMKRETNNKAVMDRLVECLRQDRARMEVGKINRFGVLVMTRQRIRPSIQHVTHEACPVCQGTGQVKNSESIALGVLRRMKSALVKNGVAKLSARLAPPIAMNLLNQRRQELTELEAAHGAAITVTPDHAVVYGDMAMDVTRKEEEPEGPKRAGAQDRHEHGRDPENETVVLGGDAPISFEKALDEPEPGDHLDRRAAQRAALDERERLRAIFEKKGKDAPKAEAQKPTAAASQRPKAPGAEPPPPPHGHKKGPAKKTAEDAPPPQKAAPDSTGHRKSPQAAPVRQSEPPKLSPEDIASLAIPTWLQKPPATPAQGPKDAAADTPQAAGGKRGRRAKGETGHEPAPGKPPERTPEKAAAKPRATHGGAPEKVRGAATGKTQEKTQEKPKRGRPAATAAAGKGAEGDGKPKAAKGKAAAAPAKGPKPKAAPGGVRGKAPEKVSEKASGGGGQEDRARRRPGQEGRRRESPRRRAEGAQGKKMSGWRTRNSHRRWLAGGRAEAPSVVAARGVEGEIAARPPQRCWPCF